MGTHHLYYKMAGKGLLASWFLGATVFRSIFAPVGHAAGSIARRGEQASVRRLVRSRGEPPVQSRFEDAVVRLEDSER